MSKIINTIVHRIRKLLKRKLATAFLYTLVFTLVLSFVAFGSHTSADEPEVISSVVASEIKSVDEVVATTVAASVAQTVDLPVSTSVQNLAISTQAQDEYMQTESSLEVKPQIITSNYENRSVISHTVKSGEDVNAIAKQYGVSAQTIKWANNLVKDTLTVGSVIKVLPIDGVLYDVKSSDTISSIAKKYKVDQTRLIGYNDLEVSGLKSGKSIILPDGVLPENERPGYVAPVVVNYYTTVTYTSGSKVWVISYGTGACPSYAFGNCTCYAYARRAQLGRPVGQGWGNAASWAYKASQAGYVVNHTPTVGAVMQNGGGYNNYGHVAIVEELLPNGDISISEMNAHFSAATGWNIVSGRIVPASSVGQYNYIH